MSEDNGEQDQPEQAGGEQDQKEFSPITTQEDLDRIVTERVRRARQKYSDYDDLKAKAAKLDKIEDQNKTEIQQATDARAAAEADRDAARAEALRMRIAARYDIDDEDADLFLNGTDEEKLIKQAERLSDRKKSARRPDPNQGQGSKPKSASTADQFAASIIDRF